MAVSGLLVSTNQPSELTGPFRVSRLTEHFQIPVFSRVIASSIYHDSRQAGTIMVLIG